MKRVVLAMIYGFLVSAPCLHGDDKVGHRLLIADDSTHRIALVNADGSIAWEYKIGPIHDLDLLSGGNVLCQLSWTRIVEIEPSSNKIVWEYDSAKRNGNEGKRVEVHAFQRLADGRTMIAESGPGRIIEVDRAGNLVHEVRLKIAKPSPHSDTRRVRKLENGNYLVCHESQGVVREVDKTGNIVWDYPVPLFGMKPKGGHGPEGYGNSVFSGAAPAKRQYVDCHWEWA